MGKSMKIIIEWWIYLEGQRSAIKMGCHQQEPVLLDFASQNHEEACISVCTLGALSID